MSESEETTETDFLISIPPDYFNVHTPNSDDRIDSDDNFDENVYVLNDLQLASVRNSLRNTNLIQLFNLKVNKIPHSSVGLSCETSERRVTNTDTDSSKLCVPNYLKSNISDSVSQESQELYNTNSCKVRTARNPFSLPSSPTDTGKSYFNTSEITVKKKSCDVVQNSAEKAGDVVVDVDSSTTNSPVPIMSHVEGGKLNVKATDNNEKKLIKEIDEYLDETKKDNKIHIPSNIMNERSDETNHIMSRFLKDDMERVKSLDLDRKSEGEDSVGFDLRQVKNLLKEIETTQSQIEKKLKSREKGEQKETDEYIKVVTWQSGDYVGAIPDLGFGVRELGASPVKKSDKPENYITEQSCVKKMFPPLGDEILHDGSQTYDTNEKSTGNKFSVRRRLNMDNSKLHEHSIVSSGKELLASTSHSDLGRNKKLNLDDKPHKYSVPGSKELSVSNSHSDFDKRKHEKTKVPSPIRFRKSSIFGLTNRDVASSNTQRKTLSSPKSQSVDQCQDFDSRPNNVGEVKHISGQNIESPDVYKLGNHQNESLKHSNRLLSLSDLWTKNSAINAGNPKLEEERYRRQHCEQLIHDQQRQILELQEKIAVAMHVDQEKNKALQQIRDAWHHLTRHWTELEEQRHDLAQELQKEHNASRQREIEITKRVDRWNTEIAQALDLAAGYKEKSEALSAEREALKLELDKQTHAMKEQLTHVEEEKNKFLVEKEHLIVELEETRREAAEMSLIDRLEKFLKLFCFTEKRLMKEAQQELQKSEECKSALQAELTKVKTHNQTLTAKVEEANQHITVVEQQNTAMQQAVAQAKQNEKLAADEVRLYNERLEAVRGELRIFYQKQLETVVKEKLKEFQDQLDSAEEALKNELKNKEKQYSDKAINQCRILTERHKEEINKREDQFTNEMKSIIEKLADCEQKKVMAEKLLQEETHRRTEIAERLHLVMEKQWKEAMKIINNASTGEIVKNAPSNNKTSDVTQKRIDTYLEMARSIGCSDSSSSGTFFEDDILPTTKLNSEHETKRDKYSNLNLRGVNSPRSSALSSARNNEDIPFGREDINTCRQSNVAQDNIKQEEQNLKYYIQMLLERPPGNPVDGHKLYQEFMENHSAKTTDVDNSKWETLMTDRESKIPSDSKSAHGKRRPWK